MSELPPGFVLQPKAAGSALPEGFVLQPKAAEREEPGQWEKFKAGLSAIAQDPSLLLNVGPARMARELPGHAVDAATLPRDAYQGKLPTYPSDYTQEQGLRVANLAGMLTGLPGQVNPAVRAGSSAIPAARRVVVPGEVTGTAELGPATVMSGPGRIGGTQQPRATVEFRNPDTVRYEPVLQGGERAAPTVEALDTAAEAGYTKARSLGVDYDASAVQGLARDTQSALEQDGILAELAPKTHAVLRKLQDAPPDSVASFSGLEAARRALGHAAKDFGNPTDQLAASRSIDRLTQFIEKADPGSVVAGPAAAAREAGQAVANARGNYAAARRSERLTGVEENATRRAEASNSGLNIDNTIRQRIASLLEQPKRRAGFSDEEIGLLEEVSRGTATRNTLRRLGNLLGGGGGLGAMVSGGVGGMAGGALGGPVGAAVGAAVPALGLGARNAANALTTRALRQADEAVRRRSPLYQEMVERGPLTAISPERRAAVLRALLMEELASQRQPLTIDVNKPR